MQRRSLSSKKLEGDRHAEKEGDQEAVDAETRHHHRFREEDSMARNQTHATIVTRSDT